MADYIYTMEVRLTPEQQRGVVLQTDPWRILGTEQQQSVREKPKLVGGRDFDFHGRFFVSGSFELLADLRFLGKFFCGFGLRHHL